MTLSDTARNALERLARYLEENGDRLVIDADTHATDCATLAGTVREMYERTANYYHGRPIDAEDLLRQMGLSGVDMCLIWQNPAATVYPGTHDENHRCLLAANRYIADTAGLHPERFIPAGWTDPRALGPERALDLVDTCVLEFGFPVVKMNPAQNAFPIDSPAAVDIVDRIVARGAIPAFHYGADTPYTPAQGLQSVSRHIAPHPLIAVHMGGGGAGYVEAEQACLDARAIGLTNPNVHFAISAKRDTHIESDLIEYQMAGEPWCRNLSCASDAPYGRMSWNFGGFRAMLASLQDRYGHTDPRVREGKAVFSDSALSGYLGGNLARLVARGCRSVLNRGGKSKGTSLSPRTTDA